jgi:hypothetical protein
MIFVTYHENYLKFVFKILSLEPYPAHTSDVRQNLHSSVHQDTLKKYPDFDWKILKITWIPIWENSIFRWKTSWIIVFNNKIGKNETFIFYFEFLQVQFLVFLTCLLSPKIKLNFVPQLWSKNTKNIMNSRPRKFDNPMKNILKYHFW